MWAIGRQVFLKSGFLFFILNLELISENLFEFGWNSYM